MKKVDETVRVEPDEVGRGTSVEALLPAWVSALEARHLADLRLPEVTRALRALSSAYVERRHNAADAEGRKVRGTLDSAGKRAAFALFYAPLHFIAVAHVISRVGGGTVSPVHRSLGEGGSILDLGCGTGAAGAAWAVASGATASVTGIDQHRWAIDEARWTYAHFGLRGRARVGDITREAPPQTIRGSASRVAVSPARASRGRAVLTGEHAPHTSQAQPVKTAKLPLSRAGDAIVAAYVLNEMGDTARRRVEDLLLAAADRGARVLVVEPISRAITPWWNQTATRVVEHGGRADEWRLSIDLPPLLKTLDHAAGLDHRELTFRTLFC